MSEKKRQEHHIYFEWYLNERAGGPPGYLANLHSGYDQLDCTAVPTIYFNNYWGSAPKAQDGKKGLGFCLKTGFSHFYGGERFYNRYISRYQKQSFEQMDSFLSNIDGMYPDENLIKKINWEYTKTIHVHTVPDVVKVKNYLRKHFLCDVKVILTCHTPESYANEQYNLYLANGQAPERAKILRDKWLVVEKRGYEEADIMIFPSKEAEEPLRNTIEGFDKILQGKDIRYVATGTKGLHSALTREEAKEKYGVSGKTVIGFIGRHNSIKGYDLLKKAAEKVLAIRDDVVFLIGGSQGNEFQPLDNPRWIEAGWVNPADLLQALDLFVLPNRQTYYDLVLLEVLSMGVPVVATATGGNISVKRDAPDMILCDVNADSMADAIVAFLSKPVSEQAVIRQNLLNVYQSKFTEIAMAQRYVDTIQQIHRDYEIGKMLPVRDDLISVVIPVYNVEWYLEECLNSVVKQTYKNLEILCVDDCTQDNSVNIIKRFMEKDSRIKLICHRENLGLGGARNTGIRAASGKYIVFVDSDDVLEKDMIERLYTGVCKNSLNTAVCAVRKFQGNNYHETASTFHYLSHAVTGVHSIDSGKEYLTDMWPSAINKLYSMDIIKKYHCAFPEKLLYEDHIFHYDYFSHISKFYYTSTPLYNYRVNRAGSITSTSVGREDEIYVSLKELEQRFSSYFDKKKWKASYAKVCFRLLWERQFALVHNSKEWLRYAKKAEQWLLTHFDSNFLHNNVDSLVPQSDCFYRFIFLKGIKRKLFRAKMELKGWEWFMRLYHKIRR